MASVNHKLHGQWPRQHCIEGDISIQREMANSDPYTTESKSPNRLQQNWAELIMFDRVPQNQMQDKSIH